MNTTVNTKASKSDFSVTVTVAQTFSWTDIQWVIDRMDDILLTAGKIKPSEITWTKDQKIAILTALEDELDAADLTIRTDDPVYSDDQWSAADDKIKSVLFDYIWNWASENWPNLIKETDECEE